MDPVSKDSKVPKKELIEEINHLNTEVITLSTYLTPPKYIATISWDYIPKKKKINLIKPRKIPSHEEMVSRITKLKRYIKLFDIVNAWRKISDELSIDIDKTPIRQLQTEDDWNSVPELFEKWMSDNNQLIQSHKILNLQYYRKRNNRAQKELCHFPKQICQFTALTYLNLANNELTKLSKSIGKLTKLELLNLSKNKLESLPKEMGNLKALGYLDVSGNRLTKIPIEIFKIKTLINILNYNNPMTTTWL